MSITNKYPDTRPINLINFVSGQLALPAEAVFTRTAADGVATYVDANGIIQGAASEAPRFNYNPITKEFLGLMMEPAAEQLCNQTNAINDASTRYRVNGTETLNYGIAPDGTQTSTRINHDHGTSSSTFLMDSFNTDYGLNDEVVQTGSCFIKPPAGYTGDISIELASGGARFTFANGEFTGTIVYVGNGTNAECEKFPNGWWRISSTSLKFNQYYYWGIKILNIDASEHSEVWGFNIVNNSVGYTTSYVSNPSTNTAAVTRGADQFEIVLYEELNDGYSLCIDADTRDTVSSIYEISDINDVKLADLTVSNGSLKWEIDGVSNQSRGDFPQVGYKAGRFRTMSTFDNSTGSDVTNLLYTSGISFPTVATVPTGARKIKFGTDTVLKAFYIWNTKLESQPSVNFIQGADKIVLPEANKADALIIVYDTDPTNTGVDTLAWPDLNAAASQTVYFGDGSNKTYDSLGSVQHTYPYPGKYKVQIEADSGFTSFDINTVLDSVLELQNWSLGYKAGDTVAGIDGFTGTDLKNMFYNSYRLPSLPAFKYTGLTDLQSFMQNTKGFNLSGSTAWVPTDLTSCSSLRFAFKYYGSNYTGAAADFPSLTLGVNCRADQAFSYSKISTFGGSSTGVPFINSEKIYLWTSTFEGMTNLTGVGPMDYTGTTGLSRTFYNCQSLVWGGGDTSTITNLDRTFYKNLALTNNFPTVDFSSVTSAYQAFYNCTNLTTLPANFKFSTTSNVNLNMTFRMCTALNPNWSSILNGVTPSNIDNTWNRNDAMTSFPAFDASNVTGSLGGASGGFGTWNGCSLLTSFPALDLSGCTGTAAGAWENCSGLTSFPGDADGMNLSNITSFGAENQGCWEGCTGLTSFPMLDVGSGTNFTKAWKNCSGLTSFPLLNFSTATDIKDGWNYCTGLTSFPLIDTSSVTAPLGLASGGNGAWRGCAGLTSFPALNLSNCTAVTGAWANCSGLTSFPALDLSACTTFGVSNQGAWTSCTSLTSFPACTFSSAATTFYKAWYNCSSLATFPANMFDNCNNLASNAFYFAFKLCALNVQSVENILVSLDASGSTGVTLHLDGGTTAGASTWTTAATTAFNNLVTKGWSITNNA